MRNMIIGASALALASVSAPAFAEEAAGPVAISGTVGLTTDYRFRGVSQSNKDFALQGSLTVAHETGIYASFWGSSIDNMVVNGRGNQEYDLTVGINKEIAGFTLGGGATYYFYPNNNGGPSNDFIEPFVSASRVIGPVTAKGTLNWAPKQAAIGNASNLYGSFELSGQVPSTPVTLNAKLGGNFSKLSFLSYGKRYMDWSIGATVPYKNVTFGVAYVDTNFKNAGAQTFGNNTYAKAGVLGSITASF